MVTIKLTDLSCIVIPYKYGLAQLGSGDLRCKQMESNKTHMYARAVPDMVLAVQCPLLSLMARVE